MKRLSEEELNNVLEQHKLWLDTDGDEGARANLSKADLYRANLSEADLRRANLYRANLSNVSLYKANLSKADLFNVNLSGDIS